MESLRHEKKIFCDVRVVESGATLASMLTGMLLSDLGAEVVTTASNKEKGFLERGKKTVQLSEKPEAEQAALFNSAQVVICDEFGCREPGWRRAERQVCCSFTVPQCVRAGGPDDVDFHVCAGAALFEPLAGFGSPRKFSFPAPSIIAALYGANAIAAALIGVERFGKGDSIEISLGDAAASLLGLKTLVFSGKRAGWTSLQWVTSPFTGIRKTADGFVYLHTGLARHTERFIDLLSENGQKEYAEKLRGLLDEKTLGDPVAVNGAVRAFRLNALLSRIMLQKTAAQWQALFGSAGLCCMRVNSIEEWLSSNEAKENAMVAQDGSGPGSIVSIAPGLPGAARKSGPSRGLPLEGVTVADFTSVIAGPLAARTLAEFGARVIRIENPAPQQAFTGPFHLLCSYGKESAMFDLRKPLAKEHFKTFVSHFKPEIVVQNFGAGVAERLGLGFKTLEESLPGLVYVNINAFGQGGPWESFRGFEQTVQAACGLQEEYGAQGRPELFPFMPNDILTGLMGSFGALASFYRRLRGNYGAEVFTSLAQAGTLFGICTARTRFGGMGKFRELFRARDRWIAVSAPDPAAVMRLAELPENGPAESLAAVIKKRKASDWIASAGPGPVRITVCQSYKRTGWFRGKSGFPLVASHAFPHHRTLLVTGSPVRSQNTGARALSPAIARGATTRRLFVEAGIEGGPDDFRIIPLFTDKNRIPALFDTVKWAAYYLLLRFLSKK